MMITFYIEWHCFLFNFLSDCDDLFSNPKKYFDGDISKEDIKNGIKKYFKQVKADINEIRKG